MARSGEAAISVARKWLQAANREYNFRRYCLRITREALGIGPKYQTAYGAWQGAKYKHKFNGNYNSVPRGVAFFWRGPSSAGHIVLTLGGGLCLTNDLAGPGTYTVAKLSTITSKWGATPLGWTEDLNGVRYYSKPAPVKKGTVNADVFFKGVNTNRPTAGQSVQISRVKKALRSRVGLDSGSASGKWDSHARAAGKRWQKLLRKPQDGTLSGYELKRLGSSPKLPASLRFNVK